MKKLKLTAAEIQDLKDVISYKEKELNVIRIRLNESVNDSHTFDSLKIVEKNLLDEIENAAELLARSEISELAVDNIVRVGDVIKLDLNYGFNDIETDAVYRLTFEPNEDMDISVKSPVGAAIFNQKIGNTVKTINGIIIDIKEKVLDYELNQMKSR